MTTYRVRRKPMLAAGAIVALAAGTVAMACANGTAFIGPSGTDGGGDESDPDSTAPDDAMTFGEVGEGSPGPICTADRVYMLSWANNLYQFDPGKLTFSKTGNLSCLPMNFSPFSMAVDRQGMAWIQGWVFAMPVQWFFHEVSTADAGCVSSISIPGTHNFETAGGGEAFVTNKANSTAETLYSVSLSGASGSGSTFSVSNVSTTTGVVNAVGPLNTDPSSGMALTGTGDARMFAAESPVSGTDAGTTIVFTERDKTNANAISTANVLIPPSYIVVGMVFWGGDFWFFLRPTASGPWMIGRYRTSDQSFVIEVKDIGMAVGESGFGLTAVAISTCAPLVPPN